MVTDIVLISIPLQRIDTPPLALANLKAVCTKHGFSSQCIDLNFELYNSQTEIDGFLNELELYFQVKLEHQLSPEHERIWNEILDSWITKILSHNPIHVGISVFSYNSVVCARDIIFALNKRSPKTKIIVGGNGLYDTYMKEDELLRDGIIDFYVKGEGEEALVNILKGKVDQAGINGKEPQQIDDLNDLPFSDFTDFCLEKYNRSQLLITGSRGCVRKCSFCDVGVIWKKYRYRSGKNIADEMVYQYKQHGIRSFDFTDSLINGSLKVLVDLCESLVESYKTIDVGRFGWGGQFIVRSRKSMNEEKFQLCADAGLKFVSIGVESGSDRVKSHMKKEFTNEDLDFTLEQCEIHNFDVNLLFIIGYPTETEEDFQDTLKMLKKYKKYVDSGTIKQINLGNTLSILPNTPLYDQLEALEIKNDDLENWHSKLNPDLDTLKRIERRLYAQEVAEELGYNLPQKDEQKRFFEAKIKKLKLLKGVS